jgi:hypothetical protein
MATVMEVGTVAEEDMATVMEVGTVAEEDMEEEAVCTYFNPFRWWPILIFRDAWTSYIIRPLLLTFDIFLLYYLSFSSFYQLALLFVHQWCITYQCS